MSTPSVHLAVLVVATDPAKADLAPAMIIRGRVANAGHQIVQQHVTKDMEAGIRSQLARWIDDPNIDVILVTGNVESDAVAAAIKPLVTQPLQGFTDLFRYLAFQEIGAGAMLSNAEAAQCNSTYLFVLPGSAGAVGTAMDKLILPQLDPNTQPKNLVSSMPGVQAREAVPSQIASEKTTGGFGISPKMPAPPRSKPPTARNVIRRAEPDPPTRVVDVAKLDRLANPNDAQTKPNIDLRKMLPNVPPGADDVDADTDILAAPAGDKRADTAPAIPPPPTIPAPGSPRPQSATGPRARPITVPPTSAFATKEVTSPGTSAPATRPSRTTGQHVIVSERRASPTGSQPTARAQTASGPPPVPARAKATTGMTVTIPKKESTEPGAVMPTRKPADSGKQNVSAAPTTAASKADTAPIGSGAIAPPKPVEPKPVEPKPVEPKPVEPKPIEPKPVEPKPEEAKSVEAKPVESKPVGPKSVEPKSEEKKPDAPINGLAAKSPSETPSVAMAPLLDANELDEDDVDSKPTPIKPTRPRAPTPPPPVFAPRDSAVDLPIGTFNYPVKKRGGGRNAGRIIALLLAAGVGFAAVVYLVPRFTDDDKPKQTAQLEQATAPAPAPTPVIEQPPAPVVEEAPPPVVEEPPAPTPKPAVTKRVTKPAASPGAVTKPEPTPQTPSPIPPATTEPPPADGCDEVGCVLSKYDRPCCERFKPQTTDLKPRTQGGVPEELDRAMVRGGVEKIKPAVVACGEKSGGVKGTVKIAVEVAPEGNVTNAEVTDSPDTGLGACVANAMKKARFGKSVNGGSFTYPFLF